MTIRISAGRNVPVRDRGLRRSPQIRPVYCSRIAALEQSLNHQRYEQDREFHDKLRQVKNRAAEKQQEKIHAPEMTYSSKPTA